MMEIALLLISTIRTKLFPIGKIAVVWFEIKDKSSNTWRCFAYFFVQRVCSYLPLRAEQTRFYRRRITFVLIVDISISAISIIARAAPAPGSIRLCGPNPRSAVSAHAGNDPSRSLETACG